jgi:hypothetical protein
MTQVVRPENRPDFWQEDVEQLKRRAPDKRFGIGIGVISKGVGPVGADAKITVALRRFSVW